MKEKNIYKLIFIAIFFSLNAYGLSMQDALDSKWYGPFVNALNELDSEYFKYPSANTDEMTKILPDEMFVEVSYYEPYVTGPRSQYFGDMSTSKPVIFKNVIDTEDEEVRKMTPIIRDCYFSGHINLLPIVLSDYAKEPQARKRDFFIYELLKPFTHDEMPSIEIESWTALADVPNPVYRLIAVEIIAKSFPESLLDKKQLSVEEQLMVADARFKALSAFFDEEDRYMRYTLVRDLGSVPSQKSLEFLSTVYSKAEKNGDLFFIYEAQQSMDLINKRLREYDAKIEESIPPLASNFSENTSPENEKISKNKDKTASDLSITTNATESEEPEKGFPVWIVTLAAVLVLGAIIFLAQKKKFH